MSMMTKKILLTASVSLLGWSVSQANITSAGPWSYGGGVYCYGSLDTASQTVSWTGTQDSGFGSMGVTLTADSMTDPTLTIGNSINNTSSFAWTEYIVDISMNQSFSINSANVTVPAGWTANITAPTGPDIHGNFNGAIAYVGGAPVAVNGTLDFGYVVSFTGSMQYSLTESVQAVPEPGVFSLLVAGGLLVGGRSIGRRRQARVLA
jgi:hypothetical protein